MTNNYDDATQQRRSDRRKRAQPAYAATGTLPELFPKNEAIE